MLHLGVPSYLCETTAPTQEHKYPISNLTVSSKVLHHLEVRDYLKKEWKSKTLFPDKCMYAHTHESSMQFSLAWSIPLNKAFLWLRPFHMTTSHYNSRAPGYSPTTQTYLRFLSGLINHLGVNANRSGPYPTKVALLFYLPVEGICSFWLLSLGPGLPPLGFTPFTHSSSKMAASNAALRSWEPREVMDLPIHCCGLPHSPVPSRLPATSLPCPSLTPYPFPAPFSSLPFYRTSDLMSSMISQPWADSFQLTREFHHWAREWRVVIRGQSSLWAWLWRPTQMT